VTTVLCLECGLVYHNPLIEDRDRQAADASFQKWHTDATPSNRHLRKLTARWARQWPLVSRVFQPGCRVLEVGSGLGVGAARLKSQGAHVVGVEPDPEQAAYAKKRWGLDILQSRFEDVDLEGEQFDLIFSSHVIEHFPDPLGFLVKIRTLVHEKTALFLETPNIIAPKVSPVRLFSLPHNFYFSPQTLTLLLKKAGWQVTNIRVFRRDVFQVLALPCSPGQPEISVQAAREVERALKRHRYLYYLKLLFLWRRFPWWQKYWMYSIDPRYEAASG
jgi:2-polyprenyl-3-methyl-5-hydroxy-6-metoxy-1,4-benzoquinol methylase